ncbi:hypothetical protein Tco_1026833 [Tanacetum coccineum]
MKGDMIIENLDLKPTINAMERDFLEVLWSFPVERIKKGIRLCMPNLQESWCWFVISSISSPNEPKSREVWSLIRNLAGMENVPPILHDIVMHSLPLSHKRTARSIVGRLILAAAAYHVWIECNNQLFKNAKRTPEEIRDMVMVTVRLKLITLRFKNTLSVSRLLEKWKMPSAFRLFGS